MKTTTSCSPTFKRRLLVAIGKGAQILARRCSWCGAWASEEDRERHEAGALITHGICLACAAKWEAQA